ncbi:MAG: hypothetical protein HY454_00110 [Parcubacteria group bacterium]|nr:hypothetical protein [Parcubacteria group bacterium]
MTTTTILKKELKGMIKESVREVMGEEQMKWRALLLPAVSKKEQRDIERLYGRPSHRVAKTIDLKP